MTNTPSNRLRPGGLWLVLALAVSLAACGDQEQAPPRAPATQPAAPAPAPAPSTTDAVVDTAAGEAMVIQPSLVDSLSVEELLARAEAAEKDKQLFVPAGESAFELYLRVSEQEPEQVRARNALSDLFPYAMLYVEQRTAAGDLPESERVLDLMRRANENAPAVPRLERGVDQLRDRIAAEAQRAAAAAPVPVREPTSIAPEVEPLASTPPPQDTPPPTPTPAPVFEPAPVAAAPAPAPTPTPTPPPPAATPAPVTPTVVSSVTPRFPPLAARRRLEGSVDVGFTIMPDGSVTNVRVLSSQPSNVFDREAINAMERWRFTATGRQIESHRIFDFKLTD